MKRPGNTRRAARALTAAPAAQAQQPHVLVDLGTGDGRFALHTARSNPAWQVIGVDACRENLRLATRTAPPNLSFVVANALALPPTLHGLASQITINFPWGSLAQGLLQEQLGLPAQLAAIARPGATLEIRLNGGALAELACELDAGAAQVMDLLGRHGFRAQPPQRLDAAALRACPSTWAKRLAFGRDPRGLYLRARYRGQGARHDAD
jgi:16S rRNA (adenine(1408)-N(1))-methyltransferase